MTPRGRDWAVQEWLCCFVQSSWIIPVLLQETVGIFLQRHLQRCQPWSLWVLHPALSCLPATSPGSCSNEKSPKSQFSAGWAPWALELPIARIRDGAGLGMAAAENISGGSLHNNTESFSKAFHLSRQKQEAGMAVKWAGVSEGNE